MSGSSLFMCHIPPYIEYHYQDVVRLYLDQMQKDSSSNNKLKYQCYLLWRSFSHVKTRVSTAVAVCISVPHLKHVMACLSSLICLFGCSNTLQQQSRKKIQLFLNQLPLGDISPSHSNFALLGEKLLSGHAPCVLTIHRCQLQHHH